MVNYEDLVKNRHSVRKYMKRKTKIIMSTRKIIINYKKNYHLELKTE